MRAVFTTTTTTAAAAANKIMTMAITKSTSRSFCIASKKQVALATSSTHQQYQSPLLQQQSQSQENVALVSVRLYSNSSRMAFSSSSSSSSSAPPSLLSGKEKLQKVLQDYKNKNYQQEIPTRFVKDILSATDKNKDGYLERDEIIHFFQNIGAAVGSQSKPNYQNLSQLTEEEIDDILLKEMKFQYPVPINDIKSMLLEMFALKK